MLELRDFVHLPQVEPLIEQLVSDGPGLIVIAGLDPRAQAPAAAEGGFLPSGRLTIFRILVRRILTHAMQSAPKTARAIVVAEDRQILRTPRQLRRHVRLLPVEPPLTYADRIAVAAHRRPDLLVIDRLDAETASAALAACRRGLSF